MLLNSSSPLDSILYLGCFGVSIVSLSFAEREKTVILPICFWFFLCFVLFFSHFTIGYCCCCRFDANEPQQKGEAGRVISETSAEQWLLFSLSALSLTFEAAHTVLRVPTHLCHTDLI